MKLYPFPDRKLTKIGIYALFLGVLLLNRDALYSGTILGFYKAQFLMLAVMAAAGAVAPRPAAVAVSSSLSWAY